MVALVVKSGLVMGLPVNRCLTPPPTSQMSKPASLNFEKKWLMEAGSLMIR